ncbi:MAG: PspA/IM30 family protein [Desulfitobacteriaceae bacterium]
MGVLVRLKNIFGAKMEKSLEVLENPKEMLDYSMVKMEEGLQSLARNVMEFAAAKKRLELQRNALTEVISKYAEQANKALELSQEDLAKEALLKKIEAVQRVEELDSQIKDMDVQLQAIAKSQEELRLKIQSFRSKKEELKAVYAASQAQLKVKELVTFLGAESENIGQTVRRAEARIQDTRARVLAIDELIEQGLITETFADSKDDVDRKLRRISLDSVVEAELAKLKSSIALNS